jgi:P2 family phage contractile tail tube protein
MIPRVLKNFNLFVDGSGLAGTIDTITLPSITVKMEEFRGGGMDAPVELDMGMEKLEGSFVLAEYNEDVIGLVALAGADKQLTARGAMQRDGEAVVPVVVNMTGGIKQLETGDWKAGDMGKATFQYTLRYYKLTIDGKVILEVDKVNMKRVINGQDQMAAIRTAIGV